MGNSQGLTQETLKGRDGLFSSEGPSPIRRVETGRKDHAADRVGEGERSEWRRDKSGGTLPWEVREEVWGAQGHSEAVSRALAQTWDTWI